MKKKLIFLFLSFLALICTSAAIVSCGHQCVYEKEIVAENYLAKEATCTESTKYYYSCKCGMRGTETFTQGEALGHLETLQVDGQYQTLYLSGEMFNTTGMNVKKICSRCNQVETVTDFSVSSDPLTVGTSKISVAVGAAIVEVSVSVNQIAITDVVLKQESEKVYYVIYGRYKDEGVLEDLYFDLASHHNAYYYVEKENVSLTTATANGEKTFVLQADITDVPASGRGFYPHLHLGGDTFDLTEPTGKWNNQKVTCNESKYTIIHNEDRSVFPYTMPVLQRVYVGAIPADAAYAATGVVFKESDGDAVMVVSGTSQGYNAASLASDIGFQIRRRNAGSELLGIDGGKLTMDENGNWTLAVRLTSLAINDDPYYTRFGEPTTLNANLPDFKTLPVAAVKGLGESITVGGKTFTPIYNPTSNKVADAYGCIGVKVSAK